MEYILKSKTRNFKIEWESDKRRPNKAVMKVPNDRKEMVTFSIDGYLLGIIIAVLERILHKWDGFIVTTGDVGDGKTTLGFVIGAIWENFWDRVMTIENIVFRSLVLIKVMDMLDNQTIYIQYDESIEGAEGGDSTKRLGRIMKKAFVQKRNKKHLYNFLIDDITNLAPQYVKRIRAWFHVEADGIKRGKYRVYTDQKKIRYMYSQAKQNHTKDVRFLPPEWYGSFQDYTGLFIDEEVYEEKKLRETRQTEEETGKDSKWFQRYAALLKGIRDKKILSNREVGKIMRVSEATVRNDLKDINDSLENAK